MEYGVIYIKVLPERGTPYEWIRYCYIFSELPDSLQKNIIHISNDINSKYGSDIIIPMDNLLHPGCTTTVDKVEEVSKDMYNQFSEMLERHNIPPCIRCVYSIGELSDINTDSTHHLGYDPVMLKLGRFLDSSDECGIFRV